MCKMMSSFLVLFFCGLLCLGQITVVTAETGDQQTENEDIGVPETKMAQDEDDQDAPAVLLLGNTTGEGEGEEIFSGFGALSDFIWQNRLVLVFAPSQDSSQLQEQRRVIECNQRGYQDRSLLVIEVVGNQVRLDGVLIDSPPASELRVRFGVQNDQFQSVFIGLDGGSKLVTRAVLTAEYLFDEIDVMPMRRQQISSQGFSVPSVDC